MWLKVFPKSKVQLNQITHTNLPTMFVSELLPPSHFFHHSILLLPLSLNPNFPLITSSTPCIVPYPLHSSDL
ncbi:hypothetical protein RJT34_11161 [Clitoria ternatea]|uniref:Uncharacterized protein n=1 Tax=Clitoria ternatea TaxID=43366 RepID=A0AAN9PJB9_CLITE